VWEFLHIIDRAGVVFTNWLFTGFLLLYIAF
jgi:hypothetical protein